MKYKKIPSINETIKKASMREARNMSALPAMRFISNVTPSRRNVSNGRRKVQRPEDKKSVGEIDWNSFAPSAGRVRGIDMLSKKESYLAPPEPEIVFDPLLDYHPGASAAYSLRQLVINDSIEYPLVKVRRGGDDVEQSFTQSQISGGALELFCSDGGGNGNGYVAEWYSQEIGERHLVQNSAVSQPTIVINGELVTSNGVPSVYFDGIDDYMDYAGSILVKDIYTSVSWIGESGPTGIGNYRGIATSFTSAYFLISGNFSTSFFSDGNSNIFINSIDTHDFSPILEPKIVRSIQNSQRSVPNLRIGLDRSNFGLRHWSGNISEIVIYPADAEDPEGVVSNLANRNNIEF